ncbi:MAG: MFS transporter [Algoriphagus sp.]
MKPPLSSSKKVQGAWAMYDWANSVYSLAITSAIFPAYYDTVTSNADNSDRISFFGWKVVNTVLYSYSISFSFLIIALLAPLLSGIADASGNKLKFMKFFVYLGATSCAGLYFFTGKNVEFGIICSILASIGFSGSIVFYNAYLPEIAKVEEFDLLSAKGFALGYIGSVILLVFNLITIQNPGWFGMPEGSFAPRFSFLVTALWWVGFAQIPFRVLPNNPYKKNLPAKFILKGYQEITQVFHLVRKSSVTKRFLVAFFFYSVGVQTVILLAASFGKKELNMEMGKLILTVLIIQLVAIGGSYLFAFISRRLGNRTSLISMIFIWIGICVAAYFVVSDNQFYALAFVVGMVMGGIQSLSRSTFAKLIPAQTTDHASFFSFYDLTEKIAVVLGTFSYGIIEHFTGSMRNSALFLGVFFVLGIIFLSRLSLPKQEPKSTPSLF